MSLETQSNLLEEKVELIEGEKIDFFIRRHWVALVPHLFVPALLVLAGVPLFLFRLAGGKLFVRGAIPEQQFDGVNILLAILVIFLGLLAIFLFNGKEGKTGRQILSGVALLLAGVAYLRYEGWRIFSLDPTVASQQQFDRFNIILLFIVVVSLLYAIYLYIEWNDDYLILTNQRVMTWNQVLLGKHSQSQIFIENIQNVMASTNSYFEHWLDFGTVTITSASFGPKLNFEKATSPRAMQGKIMGSVNKVRQQQNKQNFDKMIQAKVYDDSSAKQENPKPKITHSKSPPLVRLLFDENPHVAENGTITWRPHWIFIPLVAMKPVAFLVASFVLMFFVNQFFPLGTIAITGLTIVLVISFVAWAWYVVEDERNELYILKANELIDVEKKPLGPESRNTASLGAVQNVTYKTSFVGRIIGYGDVLIDTAGAGGQLTFPRLPNPSEVVATINDYRNRFKHGEKERSLNDTLTLLKHYHNLEEQRQQQKVVPTSTNSNPDTSHNGNSDPGRNG